MENERDEYARQLKETGHVLEELEAEGEADLSLGRVQLAGLQGQMAAMAAHPLASWVLTLGEEEIETTEPGEVPHIFRTEETLSSNQQETPSQLEAAPTPSQPTIPELPSQD